MPIWKCPKCNEPLVRESGSFVCANGHVYDVSKEGYVNLLKPGAKPHKIMGDTREMLETRRRFFEGGYYAPLRERLAEMAQAMAAKYLPFAGIFEVLEAGCGEGYYIGGVAARVPGAVCIGTDISKDAVKMGARQYPQVRFAVADTNGTLPLEDDSIDLIFDIFAPRNVDEFRRVINARGKLVVVIPTKRHLAELQDERPLGIQEEKKAAVSQSMSGYFELESSEVVKISLKLGPIAILDLLQMTPNGWFLDEERRLSIEAGTSREVTAEFEILTFLPR